MTAAPVALTCGDPAGIGTELSLKARAHLGGEVPFFWIGDPKHLPRDAAFTEISHPQDAADVPPSQLPVLAHPFAKPAQPGQPQLANAAATISAIERAVDLVTLGQASALCTNPINKKVLKDGANFAHPGHTEFLAALGGVERSVMMLASDELKVVPTTIHIALKDVPHHLTPELLEETIKITHKALKSDFGIETPRIAVAGLNPHAGEGGAMGHEELEWISPLIKSLSKTIEITGPHSADTLFHASVRTTYDAVVAMYHDQALIPIKTLAFDKGVNVTLGLPFVRTSPDHGTAFDIAGKNLANPSSLIEALKLAFHMGKGRQA